MPTRPAGPGPSGLTARIAELPDREEDIIAARTAEHRATCRQHSPASKLPLSRGAKHARGHCAERYRWPMGRFRYLRARGRAPGVALCFVAEAWGTDAVSPLAYLAAKTERILLASGIMQISARTPVTTAQTALTLATLSGNRFILGLGVRPAGGLRAYTACPSPTP